MFISSTLDAPPETTVASIFLNAFVTPMETPSTSPGSLMSMVIALSIPTTGGSSCHPTSISYGPTSTVVCAYAKEKLNPKAINPTIAKSE